MKTPRKFAKTLGDLDRSLERRAKRRAKKGVEVTLPDGTKAKLRPMTRETAARIQKEIVPTVDVRIDPQFQDWIDSKVGELRKRIEAVVKGEAPDWGEVPLVPEPGKACDCPACDARSVRPPRLYVRPDQVEDQSILSALAFGEPGTSDFERAWSKAQEEDDGGTRYLLAAAGCLIRQTRRMGQIIEVLANAWGCDPEEVAEGLEEELPD